MPKQLLKTLSSSSIMHVAIASRPVSQIAPPPCMAPSVLGCGSGSGVGSSVVGGGFGVGVGVMVGVVVGVGTGSRGGL